MSRPFVTFPGESQFRLARARIPRSLLPGDLGSVDVDRDDLALVDLDIDDGHISQVAAASTASPGATVNLAGSQVWPAFVDMHTHLDKGHIAPRAVNEDGTVHGAVTATAIDRTARWSSGDVRRRFEFALRCAYAHGTAAIRTHLDSDPPQDQISWPLFSELRAAWAGRIELQAVGKVPVEFYLTPQGESFAATVAQHGGLLGGITRVFGAPPEKADAILDAALDALFTLAARHRLDIDLHVDETGDPSSATLRQVARASLRHRFPHRVICGHCCSLATQPAAEADATLDLCAEAKLAVVTLPLINLYLQDRVAGRTPRWRGVTLVHEMRKRGIPVAVASDNCRDPFFAFGDLDMLEVYAQSVRLAHLDLPHAGWPAAATSIPAALMGLKRQARIAAGEPADLLLFRARTMSELLARPQSDRIVLRAGRIIDTTLPDYRELDDLFTP